jgi:hypothetical protein
VLRNCEWHVDFPLGCFTDLAYTNVVGCEVVFVATSQPSHARVRSVPVSGRRLVDGQRALQRHPAPRLGYLRAETIVPTPWPKHCSSVGLGRVVRRCLAASPPKRTQPTNPLKNTHCRPVRRTYRNSGLHRHNRMTSVLPVIREQSVVSVNVFRSSHQWRSRWR